MTAGDKSLLNAQEIESVTAPIESALTPPARAFTEQEFFDLERGRVFGRHWCAVAFAHTLAKPGDARPLDFLGIPLVAIRGDDQKIRVFHNICPYDGCPVVLRPVQEAKEFEVFYHGWRYDLRGRLLKTPYWNGSPDSDLSALGSNPGNLKEVRTDTRFDVVFINLDGKAQGIEEYLNPLSAELSEYDLESAVPIEDDQGYTATEGRVLQCNWKTYLENAAINVLHEAFTHEAYRRSPEVPRVKDGIKTYSDLADGPLMALRYELDTFAKTYGLNASTPHLGRQGRVPRHGYFVTYYPNIVLPIRLNMFRINICLPEAPDRTRILHCGYFPKAAVEKPDFADGHSTLVKRFHQAYQEDGIAVEAVQKARRSPAFHQHYYSPFWDIQHHHLNKTIVTDLVRCDAE